MTSEGRVTVSMSLLQVQRRRSVAVSFVKTCKHQETFSRRRHGLIETKHKY